VVCGICGRHLLRGERSVTFVADTEPHAVCDLCRERARQAGWIPAAEITDEFQEAGGRHRRNNALFDLLRRWRSGGSPSPASGAQRAPGAANGSSSLEHAPAAAEASASERVPAEGGAHAAPGPPAADAGDPAAPGSASSAHGWAIEVFNHTEQPRRIAGIARSLGAPRLTVRRADRATSAKAPSAAVRALDPDESCVTIVAAWELCWYRWELRLAGDGTSSLELVARGTSLDELPAEDLAGNATVDERGSVSLA
jgi:hypothetical protein